MSAGVRWQPHDPFGDEPAWAQPPFPAYVLESPTLGRGTLVGCVTAGAHPVSVEIRWGDPLAAAGPALAVFSTSAREWAVHEPGLADIVLAERHRLYEDPDPAAPEVVTGTATIALGTEEVEVDLRREGTLWAARTHLVRDRPLFDLPADRVVVTVVGRGVSPAGIRLRPTHDLAPYAAQRRVQLAELARHDADLAAARWQDPRLATHFALVDYEFADDPHAGVHSGIRPGRNWDWGQQLWDAAVAVQSRLTGQAKDAAEDALNSMISHVLHLSGSVPWFDDEPHRTAAVTEIVRFTVDDGTPPSLDAQRAWQDVWERRMATETLSPLFDDTSSEFDASFAEDDPHDTEWVAAWTRWRSARGP